MTRRIFLASSAALAAQVSQPALTRFQIGCMTLPYAPFPLDRALEGIARAGYKFVAWGTTHRDKSGKNVPVLAVDAPAADARTLTERCRSAGLSPVMMFSMVNLEDQNAADAHLKRIEQAAQGGLPYLLTFGRTKPGEYERAIATLKAIGPAAEKAKVTVLVKQHGGNTATGKHITKMLRDVGHESIKMCYDAGNVLDYESNDPIPDIQACWQDVRAFAIKDHRDTPKDQDCGPGFGEIDHYKLLMPVARTGLTMPLVCENIFEPIVPRPATPEGVDDLAKRAREFLETVIRGVQA
jgi:sugar phosphate isomerase/epimerase